MTVSQMQSFQIFMILSSLAFIRVSCFVNVQSYHPLHYFLSENTQPQKCPRVLKSSPDSTEYSMSPENFDGSSSESLDMEEEELMQAESKTLYEILGAPATATRAELKQRYVELAKLSHPDAQISSNIYVENNVDFNEIAQAWRVLSDAKLRKRYDRELRAAAFSERAQAFANENLEKAYPAMADIMDKVAAPLLRRTTATTMAVGQALGQGLNNGQSDGISQAFQQAVKAGQEAGKIIDGIEMTEKSEKLEEQAQEQLGRAFEIEQELERVTKRRLLATLQSKDFFLSSDEANDVLNRLSIESTKSMVDRAMFRNTVEQDIQQLHVVEAKFSEKLKEYEETDKEWNHLLEEQDLAKMNLSERRLQEIEARKALERAQRQVAEAKTQLVRSTNELRGIEQKVRKSAFEMDRVTSVLSRQQEKVRNALRKKADLIKGGIQVDYLTEEELTSLRRKEIELLGESKQVARTATRLQSRAETLKTQAESLDG